MSAAMYCRACAGREFCDLRGSDATAERAGVLGVRHWLAGYRPAKPARVLARCAICETVSAFAAGSFSARAVHFGEPARYVLEVLEAPGDAVAEMVAALDYVQRPFPVSKASAADEAADWKALRVLGVLANGLRASDGSLVAEASK